MAATKGREQLSQPMEKAPKAPRFTGGKVILAVAIVAVIVAGVGGVLLARRANNGSPTTVRAPAAPSVPTTEPYGSRPGPGGTKVLTEPVDLLTLAVPAGWKSPAPDVLTLPGELNSFALQAPPLAAALQADVQMESKSALRLFAYQTATPPAFVAVISYATPGAEAPTDSVVAAMAADAKKKKTNVAVSALQLPVGRVLKLDSSAVIMKQQVAVEQLILISGGRTMLIELAGESTAPGPLPVFADIAQSLRLR